jgi:hypothetical protein
VEAEHQMAAINPIPGEVAAEINSNNAAWAFSIIASVRHMMFARLAARDA